MASRLLNVRLAPEDGRLVQELRARGISISSVVRHAIRAEARKLRAEPVEADELLRIVMERYPTPANPLRTEVDASNSRAVREHIRTRLRRKR